MSRRGDRSDARDALARKSTAQLLSAYRAAAVRHGQASDAGDYRRCNRAHDRLMDLRRALLPRADVYQRGIIALLADEDSSVRVWAAGDALSFAPELALATLREVATEPRGMASHSATMVLDVWARGEWETLS